MANYFTAYEAERKLYNKVQPGTVWRHNHNYYITFTVKRIDPVNKLAWGVCSIVADEISHKLSFEYLVEYYNFQKRGI